MLSHEENDLLTHVGAGTPMGTLLRRYWMPACLSEELPEPDCDPIRVRLLSEDLVAFRDSAGRVGVLAEYCPHRRASLFFGRNEESGLRCLYHGWKMDVDGRVLDTPCEPADSTLKDRVRQLAYPTHEQGEVVWAYLGPPEQRPKFPDWEWTLLAPEHRSIAKVRQECNYLQAIEGAVDSAHADVLHSGHAIMGTWENDEWHRPSHDSAPQIEAEDTPYGFRYAALRKHLEEPDLRYLRMTLFVMPFHCFIAGGQVHLFVPIDDNHSWNYNVFRSPDKPIDRAQHLESRRQVMGVDLYADRRKIRSLENNFLQDRAAMRARESFSGIAGSGPNQDMAVLESMGPVADRSGEHLGASDVAVIRLRRLLLNTLSRFEEGEEPPALDPAFDYSKLLGVQAVVRADAPWQAALAH